MSKVTKILLILSPIFLAWLLCLPRQLFDRSCSTTMYAADGSLLGARISDDGQWRFDPSGDVPGKFARCIITCEDKRFRFHPGVDLLSVGRAVVQNLRRGEVVSGASTITMQVIRLSRPDKPRSYAEKLYEMILAVRLELRCSKKEILRMYASNAPFGGNVIGLEAAAWRYFGRPSEELSWAESATLAVLPNAPGLIHPGRNREALRKRRDALLGKLHDRGIIDEMTLELSRDEPLPEKPLPMPDQAHHLLERARREYPSAVVRTSVDSRLQRRVGEIIRSHFPDNHANLVDNAAVIVADIRTGKIISYYGNTLGLLPDLRGAEIDAAAVPRSSGSTLKPLLYAAMLQEGSIYPTTLIKDTPYNSNNFAPQNFSRTFEGAVPSSEVIRRSLNVPAVRMLEDYGVDRFLKVLNRLGFSSVTNDADYYGLSLILGGAEITLYDLVRAYVRMASSLCGGKVPGDLTYLCDPPRMQSVPLPFGPGAVYLTLEALSEAGRPEEEAFWMDLSSSSKVAWKTGTSWGGRDAWSVGVDGGHVVGVWVGNCDSEGRAGLTGVSYAAPIMFDVFAALPRAGWFEQPFYDMKQVAVCHDSGFPASEICPVRDTLWVPDVDGEPDVCRYHRLVHLDASGRWQVNTSCCPASEIRTESRFVLPPAMEWYYAQGHPEYLRLPPKHPDYDRGSSVARGLEIIYPADGSVLVLTRSLDGIARGAVFRAAHTDPSATLYWHLDGDYLASTEGDHALMVSFGPGKHVLTVVDSDGERRSVRFEGK